MPFSSIIASGRTFAILAAIGCLTSIEVRAGLENQDTGEQCWGQDCTGTNDLPAPSSQNGGSGSGYTTLPNVDIYDCSAADKEKIDRSVRWLQDNLAAVDAQMGQNGLMDWPGNSYKRFEKKLQKDLQFYCIDQKNKCGDIYGVVYPVFKSERINLCTYQIEDAADVLDIDEQSFYTSVVAHEIGHLIKVNSHYAKKKGCAIEYRDPRFSQALGLAAEAASRGIDYDVSEWLWTRCGITPADTTIDRTSAWEIIDNKLQSVPQ